MGSLHGLAGHLVPRLGPKLMSGSTRASSTASSQAWKSTRSRESEATFHGGKKRVRLIFRLVKRGSLKVAGVWSPMPTITAASERSGLLPRAQPASTAAASRQMRKRFMELLSWDGVTEGFGVISPRPSRMHWFVLRFARGTCARRHLRPCGGP